MHLFIYLRIYKLSLFFYICLFNFLYIYLFIHASFTDVFHMHSTYHFHEVYSQLPLSRTPLGPVLSVRLREMSVL